MDMMALNNKLLNDAAPINLDRAYAESDRQRNENRLDAVLLEAASIHVEGERRWCALRTAHCSEVDLRDSLIKSAVDAVVPTKKVQMKARRVGGRGRFVHRPVLRHLIFVRLVPTNEAFAGLLRVRGVEAVIGRGNLPHLISDREMFGFMDLAQKGAFDERNVPTGIKVGTRVKINVGPHADFEGVLEGYARSRGARVLTYLFGREVVVDVTLAQIEKLD
jgi:transcriptional antiterminator NusG